MSTDFQSKTVNQMTPDELAQSCAQVMWAGDLASRDLGMKLEEVLSGNARVSMTITDRMCNGHGIRHVGYIFTLADSAFAFACNDFKKITVAQHCSVTYLEPVRKGEKLIAEAQEVPRIGINGIYDVQVKREDGVVIAEFRGNSRIIQGEILPEEQKKT